MRVERLGRSGGGGGGYQGNANGGFGGCGTIILVFEEGATIVPATISPVAPAVIRGGFAGTEGSAAERAPGALSTIDKNGNFDCLAFDNAQSVTLDGFLLMRGKAHDLLKSGAGDLVVTNCTITGVSSGNGPGRGAHITGTASTTARFSDVRFLNILGSGTAGTDNGTAMYLSTMGRVYIDDCLFATNGCQFDATGNTLHNAGGTDIYVASGAALLARTLHSRGLPRPPRQHRLLRRDAVGDNVGEEKILPDLAVAGSSDTPISGGYARGGSMCYAICCMHYSH